MTEGRVALVSFYRRKDEAGKWWIRLVIEKEADRLYGPFTDEQKMEEAIAALKKEMDFTSLMGKGGSA